MGGAFLTRGTLAEAEATGIQCFPGTGRVGASLLEAGAWVTAAPSPGEGSPEEGNGCLVWGEGGECPRRGS